MIGSIVDYLFAPDDPEAVLARLTDPATRIVSLTVTEGGYHVNQATGEFDAADPAIQHDLERRRRPDAPRSGSSSRHCAAAATAGIDAVHRDVVRQHPGQRRGGATR